MENQGLLNIVIEAEEPMSTLIRNGSIVTPAETITGDLLVRDGRIVEIAPQIAAVDAETIDAKGCFVVPGGIDVHTHYCLDLGFAVAQDDFYSGTLAAAMGGTTTIVDHPGFGPPGCSLLHQIEKYHHLAQGNAVVDYSFHGVMQHLDDDILRQIPALIRAGITSAKVYMTYEYRFKESMLRDLFEASGEHDLLIAIHAEDDEQITSLRNKFLAQGKREPLYHARSRPSATEAEAVATVLHIAAEAGNAPIYIVHLSTSDGLKVIRTAQSNGQKVNAETCPQYLLLDEERYLEPDHGGLKYVMSPPLRPKSHQNLLWQGLADGAIEVAATDHCPFDFELKKRLGAEDFTKCPGGVGGVESRMGLLFSEGVMKNRLTLQQFVHVTAENPARIMGLLPQKGRLVTGADADVVLIDPEKKVTLSASMLHESVDYTPYEGIALTGWPVLTMVRGRVVARDGEFLGAKGWGRFIKRRKTGSDATDEIGIS